jgi:hypothetical protein
VESPSADWHLRLGHTNDKVLAQLMKKGLIPSVDLTRSACEACVLGKLHRVPSLPSASRAAEPLALLHSDVCGPFQVQSFSGKRYMLTILDDYTVPPVMFGKR